MPTNPKNNDRLNDDASIFLDILNGKPTVRPAVWLMRQAGRSLAQYRALKQRYSFYELMSNAELAADVTLQPVKYHGVDAAILFSDILIAIEALGLKVDYSATKPFITTPLASNPDLISAVINQGNWKPDVFDRSAAAIKTIKQQSNTPLIGFCGGPLTVLFYLYEGMGGKFPRSISMFSSNESTAQSLLKVITDISIVYAKAQIKAGVDAFQIFETWAGGISSELYQKLVFPEVLRLAKAITKTPTHSNTPLPLIFYPRQYGDTLKHIPCNVFSAIGIDHFTELSDAHKIFPNTVLQGNIPPQLPISLSGQKLRDAVNHRLGFFEKHPKWIVNLGHGVLPHTPQENIRTLVETVKNYR